MSETTIDNLPAQVLGEVFKWLDSESLKNVEETSEKWKEIVERSIPCTLRLEDYSNKKRMEASMDSLLASKRTYDKAIIFGFKGSQQRLLEVFAKHGTNIRELNIVYSIISLVIWSQMLKTMPELKKVTIWNSENVEAWQELNDDDLPQEKDLNKLKSLEFSNSNCILLKLFEKCQLKTLTVCNSSSRESVLNFFATQKSLEELKLISSENLFATKIPDEIIPFCLKKLVLWQPRHGVTLNDNNLLKFMKLHARTLSELEINGKFSDSFYDFVFGKLNHLKTLKLRCKDIPQDSIFYELLEINASVTSLKLIGTSDHQMLALKGVISHLPNIESLALHNIREPSVIKHIAESLKKLEKLIVNYFHGETFDGLRFEALQCLEIHYVNGPDNWDDFTRNNPSINELSIGYVSKQEYLDINLITSNLKQLHTLTIKCEINCDGNFFANIRKNNKELKSLDLNIEGLKVDISAVADISGLRFRNYPF